MSNPYFRPQIALQQEFEPLAGTVVQPQNVLLIGPIYKVLEKDDTSDLLSINYGAYDPTQDVSHAYGGLPVGGVVDQESVSLVMRDIFAQYGQLTGANVIERGANANEINIPSGNGFKTYTNSAGTIFNRNSAFLYRDVQVGDRVRVQSGIFDFKSRVIGFKNDVIAAAVASPDVTNSQANQSQVLTPTTIDAKATDHSLAAAGTYLGILENGIISDTYTLTCTLAGSIGVKQVETGTVIAAAGCTGNGNLLVVVTGALVGGSPLTNNIPVTTASNTAALVAGVIRAFLGGVAAITNSYVVGGTSATVTLTAKTPAANDATLNISIATGSATGITLAATSADTTPGSVGSLKFSVTSSANDNVAELDLSLGSFGTAFNVGTRGLTGAFSSAGNQAFVLGEKYTIAATSLYAKITPTRTSSASTYDGLYDAVYTITVVKGGLWANGPQIVVTTNNGIDSTPPITVNFATNFVVGTLGIVAQIANNSQGGLLLGDKFTIAATASQKGGIRTLLISNPMDVSITAGTDLTVTFYIYKAELEIPTAGYPDFSDVALSTTSSTFTVKAGIEIKDSTWVDGGGNPVSIPVKVATVVVPYRALLTDTANDTHSLSEISAVSLVLGKVVVDNPMAYAMDKTLANSGGQTVYYISVASDDIDGYRTALGAHETDLQGYEVIELTEDRAIRDLIDAHVVALSAPTGPKRCISFVPSIIEEVTLKYDKKTNGQNWTGFVWQDPAHAGQYSYVTVPGALFLTDGIRATDILRTKFGVDALGNDTYTALTINQVIDEENLVLVAPGLSAAFGDSTHLQRVQVVRNLSQDEQAAAVAADSSALMNRRVYSVFPDFPITVPWHFLAAAVAGLASSVAPHQPITNATINGFDDQDGARRRFTPTQLDVMAAGGTLIVTRPKAGGATFVRHQLSTDNTDDNRSELSVTRNLDSISDALEADLKQFLGRYNATDHLLQLVDTITRQKFSYFISETRTITAGPQLIAYDPATLSVVQNSTAKTQVDVNADLTLPLPVNRISITLRVSA